MPSKKKNKSRNDKSVAKDFDAQLQELEADAAKLREKINLVPTGDAHDKFWRKRGEDGNGYLEDPNAPNKEPKQPPANLDKFLKGESLMQHPIATDGKARRL